MGFQDRPQKRRWPRSQKFRLSPKGEEAEAAYRQVIVDARAQSGTGRSSYDAARVLWAKSLGIEAEDGLYLGELRAGQVTLDVVVAALETSGKSKSEGITALERLVDAGLILAPEAGT